MSEDNLICNHPTCTNGRDARIPLCYACLRLTVRRFMHAEGTMNMNDTTEPTEYQKSRSLFWFTYTCSNIDTLISKELENIKKYGPNYDRNSEEPRRNLRVVDEYKES